MMVLSSTKMLTVSPARLSGDKCWSGACLWTLNNGSRAVLWELWEFTGTYWHLQLEAAEILTKRSHTRQSGA